MAGWVAQVELLNMAGSEVLCAVVDGEGLTGKERGLWLWMAVGCLWLVGLMSRFIRWSLLLVRCFNLRFQCLLLLVIVIVLILFTYLIRAFFIGLLLFCTFMILFVIMDFIFLLPIFTFLFLFLWRLKLSLSFLLSFWLHLLINIFPLYYYNVGLGYLFMLHFDLIIPSWFIDSGAYPNDCLVHME